MAADSSTPVMHPLSEDTLPTYRPIQLGTTCYTLSKNGSGQLMVTITRSFSLCTVERAPDLSSQSTQVQGTMCLTRLQDSYFFPSNPLDGISTQHVNAIFQASKILKEHCWDPGRPFVFECTDAQLFQVEEHQLQTSLSRTNYPDVRRFQIPDEKFLLLAQTIKQLFVQWIAIPATRAEFCAEVYSQCHRGVYASIPPHIQLAIREFTNLDDVWKEVHCFLESLVIHLDANDTLPRDQEFPLSTLPYQLMSSVYPLGAIWICKRGLKDLLC
jgi:hypothetical protein